VEPDPASPLWVCPRCGHPFVTRNLWHSCGQYALADHFTGKDPALLETFHRLVEVTQGCGPVTVYAQKTRIVMMVRVRFASLVVRKGSLDLGLWLTRKVAHPLLVRTEVFGPRSIYPHFRLTKPEEIDSILMDLICEAYQTGRQAHLR
jgi:hypothetical protein